MLVLTRKLEESIVIGEDIVITVVEAAPGRVRLAIQAPRDVSIDRLEIREKKNHIEKCQRMLSSGLDLAATRK